MDYKAARDTHICELLIANLKRHGYRSLLLTYNDIHSFYKNLVEPLDEYLYYSIIESEFLPNGFESDDECNEF